MSSPGAIASTIPTEPPPDEGFYAAGGRNPFAVQEQKVGHLPRRCG